MSDLAKPLNSHLLEERVSHQACLNSTAYIKAGVTDALLNSKVVEAVNLWYIN